RTARTRRWHPNVRFATQFAGSKLTRARPVGRLLLSRPLLGIVPANDAAGCGAKHAVTTGVMAGNTADDGTFDAALRHRRGGETRKGQCDRHDVEPSPHTCSSTVVS